MHTLIPFRAVFDRLAAAQRNVEEPLSSVLESLRGRLPGPVFLLDLGEDGADPPSSAGADAAAEERWRESAARLRAALNGAAAVPTVERMAEPPFAAALAEASLALGCEVSAVPLSCEESLAGVLLVPAAAASSEWLPLVSAQLGALLLTRRELRQMRARLSRAQVETSTLLDLSRGITSTLNLEDALTSLALVSRRLLAADFLVLSLRDAGGAYSPARAEGVPVGALTPLSDEHPFVARLMEARAPFEVVADLPAAPAAAWLPAEVRAGVRGLAVAPVRGKDGPLGVLWVGSRSARRFDEFDGDLLSALAAHASTAIENSRLFAQAGEQIQRRNQEITQLADNLQQRVVELSMLHELGVMVNSVLDLRQVLDQVVKSATEISGADSAAVFLRDPRTGALEAPSSVGYSKGFLVKVASRAAERGPVAEVVRTQAQVVVRDFVEETGLLDPDIEEEGIRSLLCVPLVSEGQLTGILTVSNRRPAVFSEDEQRLFALLAGQASVAIRNARLFGEMQRRVSELTALHDLGLAVNSVLDLNAVLEMVVRSATEITGSQGSTIFLYDKARDAFRVGAAVGLDPEFLAEASRPSSGGLTHKVLREGRPIIVPDMDRETLYASDLARARGIRSQIAFPLKAEEVIGVFYVNNYRPHEFTEDELRLFSILANQATIAIKNAQLFQGLQQRVSELSAMYEVATTVSNSSELRMVLSATVLKLSALLSVDRCRILLWNQEKSELVPQEILGSWEPPAREKAALADSLALAARVLASGEVFVSNDAGNDPRILERFVDVLGIQTLVLMPLKVGTKVTGVIELSNRQDRESFTEHDLKLLSTLGSQAAAAIENARLYQDLRGSYMLTIRALAEALDSRDTYTRGHSDRVSRGALSIARSFGMSETETEQTMLAGILHDVGKIGVRESVLLKPGRLTDDEFEEIKKHPIIGARILKPIPALQPLVPLILHHHERFDGKGYPSSLAGGLTPLGSSIISVADAYDTMTSDRPYRKALPVERAVEEIHRCAGTQFNPEIVEALDRARERPDWVP